MTHMPGALKGQKSALDPLELEIQAVPTAMWCWDWKLGPLEEHPSLQSLVDILVFQISKGLLTFRALAHDALSAWNTAHSIQHLFSSSGFRVNHSARLQDCSASV